MEIRRALFSPDRADLDSFHGGPVPAIGISLRKQQTFSAGGVGAFAISSHLQDGAFIRMPSKDSITGLELFLRHRLSTRSGRQDGRVAMPLAH